MSQRDDGDTFAVSDEVERGVNESVAAVLAAIEQARQSAAKRMQSKLGEIERQLWFIRKWLDHLLSNRQHNKEIRRTQRSTIGALESTVAMLESNQRTVN